MPLPTPPTRPTHRCAMNSSARPGPCSEPRKGGSTVSLPDVVSREQWLAARKELLAKEKELTRARDALNTERRMLPMVEIDKPYVFEGPDGRRDAARPLRGPPPADPHPLHVQPRVGGRLPELHGRRRRDGAGPLRAPACPRDVAGLRRARAAGQDRALQGQAGLDLPVVLVVRQRLQLRLPRHARRVGGTRWSTTTARPRSTAGRARRTTSRAISRSSCPARATSCATATASSTPTRPSAAAAR